MYRGTTPTLTFRLPIDTGSITVLSLAVAQAGQVKIEKALSDVQMDGNVVSCTLTEAETCRLLPGQAMTQRYSCVWAWGRSAWHLRYSKCLWSVFSGMVRYDRVCGNFFSRR